MSDDNDKIDFLRVLVRQESHGTLVSFNFGQGFPSGYSDEPVRKLGRLSNEWTSFCISFFRAVPEISNFGFQLAKGSVTEDFMSFLREHSISNERREDEDGALEYSFIVHEDDAVLVLKEHGKSVRFLRAARAMESATLGALIFEYESFIDRLLTACSEILPEPFIAELGAIEAKEVFTQENIEEYRKSLLSKSVDSILRHRSHLEVLDWIGERLSINTSLPEPLRREFIEICQRRHLLTHNGGRVNKRYIDLCVAAGWTKEDLPDEGEYVQVGRKYLQRSTARVCQVALFVLHMIWQKHLPNERRSSIQNLLSVSHDFLEEGLTKMARRVIDFARFSKKDFDIRLDMYFRINEALSWLLDPNLDEAEQNKRAQAVLEKGDWSVTTPIVDLALACVRRDFVAIHELAVKANEAGMTYNEARTFVVFGEARGIDGFLDCFPKSLLELPSPSPD
ncbi:hypothetical protein HKCCSP123_05090 [Rhodobacterales bacterium HKCCSP123]|nr:hypothetical protein [Rhodobacterales bacterium HKCCSP123]